MVTLMTLIYCIVFLAINKCCVDSLFPACHDAWEDL